MTAKCVFINLYTNENNVEMIESFCGLNKEEVYSTSPLFNPHTGSIQVESCIKNTEILFGSKLDRIYIIPKGESINYFKELEN